MEENRTNGYIVKIPDTKPEGLENIMEELGKVQYSAWGFQVFFLYKDDFGWSAMFRNAAKFTNPDIKTKTPLEACEKFYDFLLDLKHNNKRI